jgi:hypothetical protein
MAWIFHPLAEILFHILLRFGKNLSEFLGHAYCVQRFLHGRRRSLRVFLIVIGSSPQGASFFRVYLGGSVIWHQDAP